MKKIILIVCFMPFLLASTCESDPIDDVVCTTQAFAGLQVKVSLQNGNLQNPSGVTVIARDDNYSETLREIGMVHTDFFGAYERKGTYVVTVSKNGYKTYTSNSIVVKADRCHVSTEQINVVLQPE
jgi:hypothetical protein